MASACLVCGNESAAMMEIIVEGQSAVFDTLECAIHALARGCDRCGCRILGHGTEVDDRLYCCAHCAREARPRGT